MALYGVVYEVRQVRAIGEFDRVPFLAEAPDPREALEAIRIAFVEQYEFRSPVMVRPLEKSEVALLERQGVGTLPRRLL